MANILIVDDEKDLADLLKEIVETEGFKGDVAFDGNSALERLEKTKFDLALLDIRLPGMNGVELFLKIKEKAPDCKVIMMTGFAVEDLIEEAMALGAYTCVHKPFNPRRIIEMIRKILLSDKMILVVDDEAGIRDFLSEQLKMEGFNVLSAKDGDEALAILKRNRVNLILLNFCLPDMDGLLLFKKARDIHKDIKVLLITGYDLTQILQREEARWLYGSMKKPIDFGSLLDVMRKVII
ncbi:MAG: response regulator [bacterium]